MIGQIRAFHSITQGESIGVDITTTNHPSLLLVSLSKLHTPKYSCQFTSHSTVWTLQNTIIRSNNTIYPCADLTHFWFPSSSNYHQTISPFRSLLFKSTYQRHRVRLHQVISPGTSMVYPPTYHCWLQFEFGVLKIWIQIMSHLFFLYGHIPVWIQRR